MHLRKTYNWAFISAIIFTIVITLAAVIIYFSVSKWHEALVGKNKVVCEQYASKLLDSANNALNFLGRKGLLENNNLTSSEIKLIDSTLRRFTTEQLKMQAGLEGGFYFSIPDEFYGYSFPTSPPPVPVYGPPPRSYNIIRDQSLLSIREKRPVINLHSFDAAIFPLATRQIVLNAKVVGAVWVRIHIENSLPILKVKQVIDTTAVVSILGFLILMLFSALLVGEVKGIKKEMGNLRYDPAYRLGKRYGIIGYITMTINKMLDTLDEENRQRQILERQLNQKENLASLGNMVAGVAHEVKTPLAIIKTRIQMWQHEVSKNDLIAEHISPESMQIVIDEINRLSNLVKRLLIFSRPIDKNLKLTDLNRLINEVVSFVNIERDNKKISVECNLNPHIPLLPLDGNSMKQVIINIINNSVEAISENGKIDILSDFDPENGKIVLEISDSGKGIPDDIINRIFDPFFTSKETGAGLGLAISYQIIKAHNGEIFFSKNSDYGTKCTIKLPQFQ
jgi:signal transduction histidine kinase